MSTGHAGVLQGWYRRVAARRSAAHRIAAHRIRVAGRSYADFAITVFGVAGAEGKAMGSASAFASCVATCRPVLQRGSIGPAPGRHRQSVAPLSVPCALQRWPRGSDHVGQGAKTACRSGGVGHACNCCAACALRCNDVYVSTCVCAATPGQPARSCGAACRLRAQNEAPEMGWLAAGVWSQSGHLVTP